jgi:acetyl-CoA C-acetyltransferase
MYPLIENAIRGARGHSIGAHLQSMARLMAPFTRVAAENPLATRRDAYTPEQLATVDAANRWIGFPYPRLMNANAFIDQAAALVMTSVGEARRLGVPPTKWIYLHGCADGQDHYYVSERTELYSSAAIRWGARRALAMANRSLDEIQFFDLYSCFPSAVEIACQEIGLAEDDPRGLTITGGLPYFGGPGNNYVTHSIAEMIRRLRSHPPSYGLITANGNYVTKHSFGVYSSLPTSGVWKRESPGVLARELDALPKAPLVEHANGPATIETYTVIHGKTGPQYGLLFGRLDATGQRFIANTAPDANVLEDLQQRDSLGRRGTVSSHAGKNLFVPHD